MSHARIARIWTGHVPSSKAERYKSLMLEVALPHYHSVNGNAGAWCLSRGLPNGLTEFKMLTFWSSLDAIRAFAGEDYQTALYYDFDDEFLVAKAELVEHFDID